MQGSSLFHCASSVTGDTDVELGADEAEDMESAATSSLTPVQAISVIPASIASNSAETCKCSACTLPITFRHNAFCVASAIIACVRSVHDHPVTSSVFGCGTNLEWSSAIFGITTVVRRRAVDRLLDSLVQSP